MLNSPSVLGLNWTETEDMETVRMLGLSSGIRDQHPHFTDRTGAQGALRALAPYLAYAYVTLVGLTNRLTVVRNDVRDRLRAQNRRFIYAFWHQRQVFFTYTHRGFDVAVMVSRSRDGEMIAETMRLSDIIAIRGSSSRGGAVAVLLMMNAMASGLDIGITPDGPKGPAREIKDGVMFLAQKLHAPIVPIANALSRRLELKRSWYHFHFPLPFGRAAVVYGQPIDVLPGDDLSAKADELKAALDRVTEEADRLVSCERAVCAETEPLPCPKDSRSPASA